MPGRQPTRLPSDLPRTRVLRALVRMGFHCDREGDEHTVYRHPDRPDVRAAIPRHSRVDRYLLRGILRRAGVTEEEFMRHY